MRSPLPSRATVLSFTKLKLLDNFRANSSTTKTMKPDSDDKDSAIKIKNIKMGPSLAESEDAPLAPPNPVEVLLWIFCSDSMKRMDGRAGFAVPLMYKNPATNLPEKLYSVHLLHQIFVGSVGGVACGIETSYIAFDRLPLPNTPFPLSWTGVNELTQSTLRNGSVVWNATKRAVVAGFVFALLDKNIEEVRGRKDWLHFSIAGAISGGIFGLRGGARGIATCSLGFAFFGAMAGFFAYFGKGDQTINA